MSLVEPIDTRRLEWTSDAYRPCYHFLPPTNWMNDPNGAVVWKGVYHLFFQHNPNAAFPDNIHWGHAVSDDLVHWQDWPVALTPEPGGPDREGCWSGCAIDADGVPTLMYFGLPGGNCIATSDDDLLTWRKHPSNPVIRQKQWGGEYRAHDACAWKEGDFYYSLSGSHIGMPRSMGKSKDVVHLFRSVNMIDWQYLGHLYEPGAESDCAVPDFFSLGDRHMLLFASHTRGVQYYIGTYAGQSFVPQIHGRMNFTTFDSSSMLTSGDMVAPICWKETGGRRVMIAWIAEGRSEPVQRTAGWAGIMSLPRVLNLKDDDTLGIEPWPQLESLRRDHHHFNEVKVKSGAFVPLQGVGGACLEIVAVIDRGDSHEVGVNLLRSPGGEEETRITYHASRDSLTLDVASASQSPQAVGQDEQTGPLKLAEDEPLELLIFVDRSVVEVFANGCQCLTKRVYPVRPDSRGIGLCARGGDVTARSVDVWRMSAIWPSRQDDQQAATARDHFTRSCSG